MRLDNYSNVLQLAAALSLAGWVARTPDSAQNPGALNPYYHSPRNGRHHPYAMNNDFGWDGNLDSHPMMVQQQQTQQMPSHHNLYQSKDAEENFQSFLELQELISWQEAYRRGDLNFYNQPQHVLPVVNKNSNDPPAITHTQERSHYPTISDDGYGSGAASLGSPASSVLSGAGTNFDDINSLSPLSDHVFNEIENGDSQSGTLGFGSGSFNQNENFDIDELLDLGDNNFPPVLEDDKASLRYGTARQPFENLKGIDEDLDYINSPLKSPTFDDFLASPMPESTPINSPQNDSFDPFHMQFTNSSVPRNKRLLETMMELGDFDSSAFENTITSDEDIDEALVKSLSTKSTNVGGASVLPHATVKEEFPFKGIRHPNDHDYQKPFTSESYTKKSQLPFNNYMRNERRTESSPLYRRTFAPTTYPTLKRHKNKSALLWPDFHYTSDELISMPVEAFNEIIKSLDAVRQHAAKDIRRKGKNKLAARNCRKRKMDVIEDLDTGVEFLEMRRLSLLEEKQKLLEETRAIKKKTEWLNSYIFEHLRDANGSLYSSSEYSLQYTSDGNVYLVPSGQIEMKKSPNVA